MAAALGVLEKLMIGATSTVDTPLEMQEGSTIRLSENFLDANGIRGTLSHTSERVRRGTRIVNGTLNFQPNTVELDSLLPWIYGATETTDDFPLSDSTISKYVSIDRTTKVFVYDGCVVQSATFSATEGGPLNLSLSILGIDETVNNSGTQPSFTLNVASGPFVMSDCAVTVGGQAYSFQSFNLTIAHTFEAKYFNSNAVSRFNKIDRTVTWSLDFPYGDASAIYAPSIAVVAVVSTFTNAVSAGLRLIFSSSAVQTPRESPTDNGRNEILLPWVGTARRVGSTLELVTTCDSTA